METKETHIHLMRAFAGESQARNRYTIAAEKAKEKGFYILEQAFLTTADQERAHAAVFYNHLQECTGQTIAIDGTYPVDLAPTITELLAMAQHNELNEADDIYPAFAAQAEKDGYPAVAASFRMIAQIEACHAARFRQFEEWLTSEALFLDGSESCVWMCQNCGHVHVGKKAPGMCPVCSVAQGYFLRSALAPYTDVSMTRVVQEV